MAECDRTITNGTGASETSTKRERTEQNRYATTIARRVGDDNSLPIRHSYASRTRGDGASHGVSAASFSLRASSRARTSVKARWISTTLPLLRPSRCCATISAPSGSVISTSRPVSGSPLTPALRHLGSERLRTHPHRDHRARCGGRASRCRLVHRRPRQLRHHRRRRCCNLIFHARALHSRWSRKTWSSSLRAAAIWLRLRN